MSEIKDNQSEDVYRETLQFPTLFQRWTLIYTDPVWYRFILTSVLIEVWTICYKSLMQMDTLTDHFYQYTKLEIVFNIMYLADVVMAFLGAYYFKLKYPSPNPAKRPFFIMIIEFLSIIPLKYLFLPSKIGEKFSKRYHASETLQLLKILRCYYHMRTNRRALYSVFITRLIDSTVVLFVFIGVVVKLVYLITYDESAYIEYMTMELMMSKALGRNYILTDILEDPRLNVFNFELLFALGNIFLKPLIAFPTLGFMIMSIIELDQHRFNYATKVTLFKNLIVPKFNLTGYKYKMLMNYFDRHWKLLGGFTVEDEDAPENINQFALKVEVAMDYSWAAFKHCYIFKDVDLCLLRNLAMHVGKKMRMEGEFIFQKNRTKPGMVYIASGIIEVLSFEDNDTAILSFTAGTCIGTASLIYPHSSAVDFRCKTICEVYELNREPFLSIANLYAREYIEMKRKVSEKISIAKSIKAHNARFENVETENTRIMWLKHNLHRLLDQGEHQNSHKLQNIFLQRILNQRIKSEKNFKYTVANLASLVLVERNLFDNDLVFVKATCPWILQPNSTLTVFWEYIIVILSIISSIIITWGFAMGFSENILRFIDFIHLVYIFDLCIQLITPIERNDEKPRSHLSKTTKTVIGERLKSFGFMLDIICTFHWKIVGIVADQKKMWHHLIHLLKLWRLLRLYHQWCQKFLVNVFMQRFILAVSLNVMLIYVLSWLFAVWGFTDSMVSPISIQYGTGSGLNFENPNLKKVYSYLFPISNFASHIVENITLALICGASYLFYASQMKIMSNLHKLSECAKAKNAPWLHLRLVDYINTQMNDSEGIMSRGSISEFYKLPKYFESVMKSNIHLETLKQIDLLKCLPSDLVETLSLFTEIITWSRHSRIISRGVIYKEIYVIIKGDCRTLMDGNYFGTRTLQPLNFLEACYKLPACTTVVALSDVMVLRFDYVNFRKLLNEHEQSFVKFNKILENRREEAVEFLMKLLHGPVMEVRSLNIGPKSIKCFAYFARKDSYEESNYHIPFDRISLHFVKYFLMRITFYPDGFFLKYYEIQRCFIAFIASIFFTTPVITLNKNNKIIFYFMIFLDCMAILDIYIRFHIGYYNDDGILVTHPLYTAKRYLTHSFLIDLLAMLPFDLIPMKVHYKNILYSIHALQLYRIKGLNRQYTNHPWHCILTILVALSSLIFITNLISGLLYVYDCYAWNTQVLIPPKNCTNFKYPSELETNIHILYLVMSAMCKSGIDGAINVNSLSSLLTFVISILCFVGISSSISQRAYIFTCLIKKNWDSYKVIDGYRKLQTLMRRTRDNKYLRNEVAFYYDTYFTTREHDPTNLPFKITKNLRRDLLYHFYGNATMKYSILGKESFQTSLFMKNIMLQAQRMIVPKNGYLITINDVEADVYVLNRGNVDVLAADGTKLDTLCEGSIFGNIKNQKYSRQKVSVIANVNAEVLCLTSEDFHGLIRYFPSINHEFDVASKKYMFYVKSNKVAEPIEKMTVEQYLRAIRHYASFQIVSRVHLIFTCILGIPLEMYQLTVGENHWLYLMFLYILDLLHILHEFLKFKMPYKDQHKAPVFDSNRILKRQLSKKLELAITILSLLYIDWFLVLPTLLSSPYSLNQVSLYISLLRLNRLLRIFYIYKAYKRRLVTVSNAPKVVDKWLLILYYVFLSYQLVALISANLDYYFIGISINHKVSPEVIQNLRSLTSQQKFTIYIRYLYFSCLIHGSHGTVGYGPTSTFSNIYVISLYLYAILVHAVAGCKYFDALMEMGESRRDLFTYTSYLKFYCSRSEASFVIKDRLVQNCKHAWSKKYYQSLSILEKHCSRYLREAVTNDLYGYLFSRHCVLGRLHFDLLRQLGLHYNLVIYPCDSVIVYKNDHRDCMFFLHKGEVAAYDGEYGYRNLAVEVLTKGASFGIMQGLQLAKRFEFTYITLKHCEIIELEWDKWNHLLEFFPAAKKFLMDEALKYERYSSLSLGDVKTRGNYNYSFF